MGVEKGGGETGIYAYSLVISAQRARAVTRNNEHIS